MVKPISTRETKTLRIDPQLYAILEAQKEKKKSEGESQYTLSRSIRDLIGRNKMSALIRELPGEVQT